MLLGEGVNLLMRIKRLLIIMPLIIVTLVVISSLNQAVEAKQYYVGDTPTGHHVYLDDTRIKKRSNIIWADIDLIVTKEKKKAGIFETSFFILNGIDKWQWCPRQGTKYMHDCVEKEWSGNVAKWLENNMFK